MMSTASGGATHYVVLEEAAWYRRASEKMFLREGCPGPNDRYPQDLKWRRSDVQETQDWGEGK